jgi:hypothetical protein
LGGNLMAFSESYQKEIWNTSKIIEELHFNLISAQREDGLRKYEELAKFLLYRIPVWREPESGHKQPPDFIIDLKNISNKVKEQLVNVSDKEISKSIVIEAVSRLFENLGQNEKEYFNKNVRHLLTVRFI